MSGQAARLAYRQTNNGRSTDAEVEFNQITDFVLTYRHSIVDAASTTATTNRAIDLAPFSYKVISAKILQKSQSTVHATSLVTWTVTKNDAANSTMLTVSAFSNVSATVAAGVAKAMTLTAANTTVATGKALYVSVTKAGAGKKVPAGSAILIHCRRV
jgi:hypothetical protein